MKALLHEYRELELEAHTSTDDVIAKVSEESYELSEALQTGNIPEIEKESRDVIMNVVSVASKFFDMDSLDIGAPSRDIAEFSALVARWSRETAALRGRYSREEISLDGYKKTTADLLSLLVPLSGNARLDDSVAESIAKMRSRVRAYLPDISLEDHIASYPDFPKPGILFRDISPLLAHPEALRYAGFELARHAQDADVIAGLDAR